MNNGTLVTSIIKSTRRVRDQYDAAMSRAAHQCGITRPEADVLLFFVQQSHAQHGARHRLLSRLFKGVCVQGGRSAHPSGHDRHDHRPVRPAAAAAFDKRRRGNRGEAAHSAGRLSKRAHRRHTSVRAGLLHGGQRGHVQKCRTYRRMTSPAAIPMPIAQCGLSALII